MFTKGAKIEVKTSAHSYAHMGITDPGYLVRETCEIMTVKSARQTQDGLKVHFRREDNTGYAVIIDKAQFHSFKAA